MEQGLEKRIFYLPARTRRKSLKIEETFWMYDKSFDDFEEEIYMLLSDVSVKMEKWQKIY